MASEINKTAVQGFGRSADQYANGRPDYPLEAIDFIAKEFSVGEKTRIVDLAAGTGKLTSHLLQLSREVVAVEPVEEMRKVFAQFLPVIPVFNARAENLPLPDESVDVVTVATAFHWFDYEKAYHEVARVLKPGGHLALIWNQWKNELPDWLNQVREIVLQHKGETPRYFTGEWKAPFEKNSLLTPLNFRRFTCPKKISHDEVVGRMLTISFIAALPGEQVLQIEKEIREILSSHPETKNEKTLTMPYEFHLYWCEKK